MAIEETANLSWHEFDFPRAVSSHAEACFDKILTPCGAR
jgi:hypothetical protein